MTKRSLLVFVLFSGLSLAWAGNVSVNDAALAAQSVARPNYGSIVTNDKRNDVVNKDFIGDTSDLSDLRTESGMGDLFTPGSNKANGCLSKNDPECLAVQLVYRAGANKPDLSDEEKDKILGDYEEVIGNTDDLIASAGDIVSSETHCETVSTVIPGLSEIEVCDEATGGIVTGTCSEGWKMEMGTRELYRCHTNAVSEAKTCRIEKEVLSHTENRYSCIKAPAEYNDAKCTVPVTVDVKKTYPYQCTIETRPPTTETCIRTLGIEVIAPCTADQKTNVSLKDFKDVGYTATGINQNATVSYACSNSMKVTIKIGTRTMGSFTSAPSSFTATNRIPFIFSIEQFERGGRTFYTITITNQDTGKGTRTVSTEMQVYKPEHGEIEHWESVCR